MHRNVAEFTSPTLVISHVIVCYPLLIPMSETIFLCMSQTEFIRDLGYKWNFEQSYFSRNKINGTQSAKQLIEYNLKTSTIFVPQIAHILCYGEAYT